MQPGQVAQASPLAQTFTAWFRGPGLTSTALSLAIVLGSAAISAILTMVAMSTTDSTKTFPTTFSTLPLLMGWSLGGQFVMSGSNSYETITLTFTLLPMGALTAAGIGVFWLARRRAAVDGSAAPLVPTLARAGAEALAVALVACLVTAPFSMTATMMGLKVMTVSSSALMTILLVTVVVFVALVVARSGGSLLERLPSPVVQLGRELGALSTALGVVLGVFVVLAYIAAVLIQGSGFASILLLPVLLPNLVLLALGLGSLGGITMDKSEAAAALAYFLPSLGGRGRWRRLRLDLVRQLVDPAVRGHDRGHRGGGAARGCQARSHGADRVAARLAASARVAGPGGDRLLRAAPVAFLRR